MQGNPDAPRCGFSQKVVSALRSIEVPFNTFDILSDEEVRQGLKEYSQWPTYPQLYVKGELLGGCDVILELQQDGNTLLLAYYCVAPYVRASSLYALNPKGLP